ncbi:hypothetical protein BC628DRAFT_1424223 [Trametes gibbosa]|nr:hypothetical protein BC628DRAFT_1424223 [Trametes gibbosa]
MPAPTLPSVPHYTPAAPTKEDLDWAPLPVIDFAEVGTPEGRAALGAQVREAMRTYGFLYIVNHGYTQAQVGFFFKLQQRIPSLEVTTD